MPDFSRSSIPASPITEDISNMRSLNTALLMFYATNDEQYPENLKQLAPDDMLGKGWLKSLGHEIIYFKGLDAGDGDKIIFHTPVMEYGKVIVGYVDGSVVAEDSAEFEELLKKQ